MMLWSIVQRLCMCLAEEEAQWLHFWQRMVLRYAQIGDPLLNINMRIRFCDSSHLMTLVSKFLFFMIASIFRCTSADSIAAKGLSITISPRIPLRSLSFNPCTTADALNFLAMRDISC